MIVKSCFQRFYWGNRVRWFLIYVCISRSSDKYYELATRVVIHSYLYSGLRPSVRGKITSDNGNLRNLRYTKETPILDSLHSRVYLTFGQLAPPLSEGARAQIMTQGPLPQIRYYYSYLFTSYAVLLFVIDYPNFVRTTLFLLNCKFGNRGNFWKGQGAPVCEILLYQHHMFRWWKWGVRMVRSN